MNTDEAYTPPLAAWDDRDTPEKGQLFLHNKTGKVYEIISLAINANNGEQDSEKSVVVYKAANLQGHFVRRLDEFLDNDGKEYRFSYLEPEHVR